VLVIFLFLEHCLRMQEILRHYLRLLYDVNKPEFIPCCQELLIVCRDGRQLMIFVENLESMVGLQIVNLIDRLSHLFRRLIVAGGRQPTSGVCSLGSSPPPIDNISALMIDCLEVRKENNQNCSLLYCVRQLCTVIRRHV